MSIDDEWKQSEVCDLSLANRTFVDLNTPDHTVIADETGKLNSTAFLKAAQSTLLRKTIRLYKTKCQDLMVNRSWI